MTRRKKRPLSLLAIHLDSESSERTISFSRTSVGSSRFVATLALGATVVVNETTILRNLLDTLGDLAKDGRRFDVVAAIGHANHGVIKAARDADLMGWETFAT